MGVAPPASYKYAPFFAASELYLGRPEGKNDDLAAGLRKLVELSLERGHVVASRQSRKMADEHQVQAPSRWHQLGDSHLFIPNKEKKVSTNFLVFI